MNEIGIIINNNHNIGFRSAMRIRKEDPRRFESLLMSSLAAEMGITKDMLINMYLTGMTATKIESYLNAAKKFKAALSQLVHHTDAEEEEQREQTYAARVEAAIGDILVKNLPIRVDYGGTHIAAKIIREDGEEEVVGLEICEPEDDLNKLESLLRNDIKKRAEKLRKEAGKNVIREIPMAEREMVLDTEWLADDKDEIVELFVGIKVDGLRYGYAQWRENGGPGHFGIVFANTKVALDMFHPDYELLKELIQESSFCDQTKEALKEMLDKRAKRYAGMEDKDDEGILEAGDILLQTINPRLPAALNKREAVLMFWQLEKPSCTDPQGDLKLKYTMTPKTKQLTKDGRGHINVRVYI